MATAAIEKVIYWIGRGFGKPLEDISCQSFVKLVAKPCKHLKQSIVQFFTFLHIVLITDFHFGFVFFDFAPDLYFLLLSLNLHTC